MREKIEARNGMILTNGEIYGRTIFLGTNLNKKDFHEITVGEYERTLKEQANDIRPNFE
jgi:hypothetical protein